jgi:hypothetical protein
MNPSRTVSIVLVAAGLGLIACSGDTGDETAGPDLGGGGVIGKGGTGTGGGSAASGNGGGINVGGGGTGTGGGGGSGGAGCDKIDFLFIVDNSVSMQDQQTQLVAAFPGFISTIESTVSAGSNVHVMVADTDPWGRCNTANPWTGMDPSSTTCNSYIKNTKFAECDRTVGAGVVHPAGQYASNKQCNFPAGRRFLQQGDTDIPGAFGCAAKVGVAGHPSERPMDALMAAITPGINAAGGCNEGFLRDDALLVVTFISDDPNYEDQGTPQGWYDAVVAAKKGDPKAAVMVGFTPAFADCPGDATKTKGKHWAEFVGKFPFNLHASVCAGNYDATFAQAVKVIDEGCDQYVPPVK